RPEADTRWLVEKFLCLLGHSEKHIKFEVGRIDVTLIDATGKPWAIFEVKKSLDDKRDKDDGRRKGFDYANKVGAHLVVLTDADRYDIYDNDKSGNYDEKLRGSFKLTHYKNADDGLLDMLRPKA
ncbi:MAG: hypothetical protein V1899_07175, partial [Planctomycetota bacterium]